MTSPALEVLDNNQFPAHRAGVEDEGKFTLCIKAWGTFPTSGGTSPRLELREDLLSLNVPADARAEFNLIAEPPESGTIVLNVISALEAFMIMPLPHRIHEVHLHGWCNVLERFVSFQMSDPEMSPLTDGDNFVPIPWGIVRGGADIGG